MVGTQESKFFFSSLPHPNPRVSFDGAAGTELGYIKALSVRVKLGGLGRRKMIKGINRTGRGFFWGGLFYFFLTVLTT